MGQPTLPPPAASIDEFTIKSNRPSTSWCKPEPYSVSPNPEKTLGPYWKSHPRSAPSASEMMGLVSVKQQQQSEVLVAPAQNVVVPLFQPGSEFPSGIHANSMGETVRFAPENCEVVLSTTASRAPADHGDEFYQSLARYTSETSPPAPSRTLRQRSAAAASVGTSAASRVGTPLPSSAPRTHPVRDRRAARKGREQKRRDVSRPSAGKSLSEIAEENPQVLVPDAEAFANRPVGVRRQEAAEAGKIKRPLNAFMLYRRSYQNVAKTKCLRNNHQQVSTVCGDSWKTNEPQEILDKFNRLAIVEKEMHEQAFPDYKYDPVLSKKATDIVSNLSSSSSCATTATAAKAAAVSSDPDYGSRAKPAKQTARKRAPRPSRPSKPAQPATVDVPIKEEPAEAVASRVATPEMYTSNTDNLPYFNQPSPAPAYVSTHEAPQLFFVDSNRSDMFHAGAPPTMDASQLAIQAAYISSGVIDPRLFYVDTTYIDTALLGSNSEAHDEHALPSSPIKVENEDYRSAMIRQDDNLFLPDMDQNGAYNAYLKGTDEDWEVMPLDEGTQFEDWIAQTEAYSSWA